MNLKEKILILAKDQFDSELIQDFIKTLELLKGDSIIVDSFLQISKDHGDELELGFFTADSIVDITLSRGKIYSCEYPLAKVKNIYLSEVEAKWVLVISGDKKFDYNVVKPASANSLKRYESNLRNFLQINGAGP